MKSLPLPLFALLLSAAPLSATTVSLSDFSGFGATFVENTVVTTAGAALTNSGALVRVGFFTDLSAPVLLALQSADQATAYSAVSTYFVGLGEGGDSDLGAPASGGARIAQRTVNGVSQPGRLAGNTTGVNPGVYNPPGTVSGVPADTRLFVLVYDAITPEASTELGIFSADEASWRMPSDTLLNVTLNTVAVDAPGEVFRGVQLPGQLRLGSFVPEPGVSALAALGALLTGLRRRRRQGQAHA